MELKLLKINEEDLSTLMEWRMLPEVTKYMYTDPKLTLDMQREWYNTVKNNKNNFLGILYCDNKKIGFYNIKVKGNRCYIGHYIGNLNFRKKGIGTIVEYNLYSYCFNEIRINEIIFEVLETNKNAIKMHLNLGCTIKCKLKNHVVKNKIKYDVVVMSISKEKWIRTMEDRYTPVLIQL